MFIGSQIKPASGPLVDQVEYNKLVSAVNRLRNLNFDNRSFSVLNRPNGVFVTLRGTATTTELDLSNLLFGWSISGNKVTINKGEVQFKTQIFESVETELTIANDKTYIYLEMEFGTGICTIKQTTVKADATSSDSCFRKWLILVDYTAPSSVKISDMGIGWMGGAISIVPIFA